MIAPRGVLPGRIWFMVICPLLATSVLCGCGEKTEEALPVARPVRFFEAGTSAEARARTYPGVVQASQEVDLAFRVGGPLVELNATEGERVDEGTVIARIDPRDFSSRLAQTSSSLESAQAELKAMKAGARPEDLREMEAAVASAQSRLNQAEADYKRAERLFAENAIAQRVYEEASTKRDQAKAALEQVQATLEKGRTGARPEDIEATEADIRRLQSQKQEAEDALNDATLVAPFTGLIARRYVDNHQTVSAGEPIVKLQNKDTVDVVIQIPERDLAKAPKRRQEVDTSGVEVVFDNYPDKPLPVSLKEFQTEADPDTQTYAVRLSIVPPADMVVQPGMAASVQVTRSLTQTGEGGLIVPAEAVFQTADGQSTVWVIDSDTKRVSQRAVEVGALVSNGIQVTEGLAPGETIAATGVHYLREGMEVRAMNSQGDAP